jgi:hypothetical protein
MTLPANAMSNPASPPLEPVPIVLVRKLILLVLLMIVAALGLVLLLRNIQIYSLLVPHILSDAAMGLIAGFSVRLILRNQTVFLRIISVLAFLIGGLELLGWFTGWQIGLGPLRFGLPSVDWYSLGQLLLGTGIALLVLYAWTHPPPVVVDPLPEPKPYNRVPRPRPQLNKRPRRPVRRPRPRSAPAAVAEQIVEPKRKRLTQPKPQLQLSEKEEHRCPYCLELIEPDDPRGTVECNICHTLHHADCWAITGACQVPHFTV